MSDKLTLVGEKALRGLVDERDNLIEENEKLRAVVAAAVGIRDRERIGGYGHEGIPELLEALERLIMVTHANR